jgi:hypothetical protein
MWIDVGGEVVAVECLKKCVAGIADGGDLIWPIGAGGLDRLRDLNQGGILDCSIPVDGGMETSLQKHRFLAEKYNSEKSPQ